MVKQAIGIIKEVKYTKLGDIKYIVEITNDNIKVKSISYAKMYKRLKKGDIVDVEYYFNKNGNAIATILDDELVPCVQNKTSIFFIMILLFLCIAIALFIKSISAYFDIGANIIASIVFIIIFIIYIGYGLFLGITIIKKGKLVKAEVIKKEFEEIKSADIDTSNDLKMKFVITVKFQNKILNGTFVIDSYTEKIKVGDTIEIILYKDNFLLNNQEHRKK